MLTAKNTKVDFLKPYFIRQLCSNLPRGNFAKNAFGNVSKYEKFSELETKDYHNKALEKANNFGMTFDDPTKAMT